MFKRFIFLLALLAFSLPAFAEIQVLSPVEATLASGSTIQAGNVGPGQVFEVIFSDNSGLGFEWDTLEIDESSMPPNWRLVSTNATDVSLVSKISVPATASPNFYVLKFFFSNSKNPVARESLNVSVVVKRSLLDVSFIRPSSDSVPVVGEEVMYKAIVSNSSIAPQKIVFSSDLPSNWFDEIDFEAKPNTTTEIPLAVNPRSYGKQPFAFLVSDEKGVVLKSFSSELNVRPTLKGKFSSALAGFPFFTFSLVPFQLFDSLISIVIPA